MARVSILVALWLYAQSVASSPAARAVEQVVLTATDLSSSNITFNVQLGAREAVPLDPQLISMSIEFCYATSFVGEATIPNLYARQLLQNIEDRSGYLPVLRIGGNTQDVSKFCENCPNTLNNTYKPGSTEAINVTYSKNLFKAMNENLSPHQSYVFGINLGQDNLQNAMTALDGALKYLNQTNVIAYELGNEPDHYATRNPIRPPGYGVLNYGTVMLDWLTKLNAGKNASFAGWQFGSMAGNPADLQDFTLIQLLKMNVPQRIGNVKILSGHSYIRNRCVPAQAALVKLEDYVNHHTTVQYWSIYASEIAAAKAHGMSYHMGETNSVACHGLDGVSNTIGALLWEIDYSLYLATLGVDKVFFHNGYGDFVYSMWQPAFNGSGPILNPTYYSMIFVADAVAGLKAPRILRIAQLDTYDLAHYAIYDSYKLRKVVVLNTHYFNGTGTRPVKTVNVSSLFGKQAKATRLTGPSTTATNGTSWGGQSVDSTGKFVGKKAVETSSDGSFRMSASEALIIEKA